jgi:hypothetical protein
VGPARVEARWTDREGVQVRPPPTVEPDSVASLPEAVGRTASLSASFPGAFGEAVRTAARDSGRFALTRILIRGKAGQVVATDGQQLLVQSGFAVPWADDLLVPAVPALAAQELATGGAVTVGRSANHVLVTAGPWTFALAVVRTGKFPRVEAVIPTGEVVAWCTFDRADVPGLVAAVANLPGRDDPDAPVTLDLAKRVAIRAA